jgi:nitrogen fixation protein NifQ
MADVPDAGSLHNASRAQGGDMREALFFDHLIFRGSLRRAFEEREKDGASLARRVGLGGEALIIILALYMPHHPPLTAEDYVAFDESEEQEWLRDLLERNRSTTDEGSLWLAAIIARRALEAGHLWEDLGMPDRPVLRRLMERYFAPLAARKTRNMRWKRFFYRQLCEEEGLSHCTSPTCSACSEVATCFAPESAEAMMALSKRAPA